MIPYFDHVLEVFKTGNQDYLRTFGHHAHWGYWPDPAEFTGTVSDFESAADEFGRVHFRAAEIKDGQSVLDAGCGFGGTIGLLNDSFERMKLTGVNIDPKQLERANELIKPKARNGNTIEFILGDASELDVPAESLDAVTALECIYHFPSRQKFMQRVFSALKPGGRLVVSDYVPIGATLPVFKAMHKLFRKEIRETSGPMSAPFGERDYERLARSCGFRVMPWQDMTKHTVQSCDVFANILRDQGEFGKRLAVGFRRQRWMCESGAMRYLLMTFRKPGGES
jgi:ubiquinone/menaquinone biosynthesis C-methylase UbiE